MSAITPSHVPYMCRCLGMCFLSVQPEHAADHQPSLCCTALCNMLHSALHLFMLEIFNSDLAPLSLSSSVSAHTSRPEFLICKCEPSVLLVAPCSSVNERLVKCSLCCVMMVICMQTDREGAGCSDCGSE